MVSPEVLTEGSLNHSHTDNTNKEVPNTNGQVDNSNPSINIIQGVKQPSYLNLACCISGYTTLTTYNSKQREGFRSRDISPARITGAPTAPDDGVFTSVCGNFLTPTPQPRYLTDMDHRKKSGDKMWNGNGQVDKLSSTFTSSSSASISGNSSFYHCETRKEVTTSRCLKESSTVSHSREVPLQTSSFILQRVERLYGPGALAQGFYTRRSHSNSHSAAPQKEAVPEEAVKDEVGASALPVLRLLRPEFRAQLSLAKRKSGSPSARASDSPDGAVERVIPIIDLCCGDKTENHKQIEERETATKPIEKDGPYYLKLVTEETERLLLQAAELEAEMASAPEHAEGRLRAAAGKARLLANQKLAQFKGLCHKNINQDLSEDFPTTCEDLAGFWDMVSIQVNSVHEEFNQIDALRKAGWPLQEASEDKKEVLSNGCGSGGPRRAKAPTKSAPAAAPAPAPAKSSLSKARDEARKRMLAERRKEMRKNANTTDDIVIV